MVLTIYTLETCKRCRTLKEGLNQLGINYKEINVDKNPSIGDKIEEMYKCFKYPMVYSQHPSNIIWLSESSLLPSSNVKIYNSIDGLLEQLKNL